MSPIQRLTPASASRSPIHAELYLAGQTPTGARHGGQTRQCLDGIDRLLGEPAAQDGILRRDLPRDMATCRHERGWTWVRRAFPCRATVQSRLAKPEWRVEIVVTAAVA